jgi:ABC-type dipeptide/oligopeptide/nickel transport system permease component
MINKSVMICITAFNHLREAKMRILVFALGIILVFASIAAAQTPATICQQYAKDARYYQQQNQRSGCGLRGPQWNDNFRYHYNWCVQGNNWRNAARWTAWRASK